MLAKTIWTSRDILKMFVIKTTTNGSLIHQTDRKKWEKCHLEIIKIFVGIF